MRRAARADHVISNVPTGSSKSPLCGERGRRTNRELQALAHLRVENLAAVHVEPRRERRIGKDGAQPATGDRQPIRSEEHTSELPSLMRISYAVFCLKNKKPKHTHKK